MITPDFSKINSFHLGQRQTFEELVCQLSRLELFPEHSVFKRVEGAGGDGGVESYWTVPSGKKTGYQAKFFLHCRDIDWSQIDKSVIQALNTHSTLECYVIALPCDLTDRAGNKQRGKTGWQHWETHVTKWKNEASDLGINEIKFVPWTNSELLARLMKTNAEGLIRFFFGDLELSKSWFRDKIHESIFALDERFHPEDHVDVRIERLFPIISRTQSYRNELTQSLEAIEKCISPTEKLSGIQQKPDEKVIDDLQLSIAALFTVKNQINLDQQHKWNTKGWLDIAKKVLTKNKELQSWLSSYKYSLDKTDPEVYQLNQAINAAHNLRDSVVKLENLVKSRYMEAESSGFAIIRGYAGTGKSHLLAKCAKKATEEGQPAILLLGQRLNDIELWTQISHNLGLTNQNSDEILGALDSAGKLSGSRTLLLIDAINEGSGCKYWRNQITSLIHKIGMFSHICCVISCRTEYFNLAIPKSISDHYPIFDIRGFETPEEQLNAARVYLDRRGIARPSTPWLSPEFVNPLFLRSVCISLERDNRSEFPSGLSGTSKMLKYYLDSVGRNISEKEGSTLPLALKLGRSVHDIAGKMLENKKDFLRLDDCRDTIALHFQYINPRSESDWLSILLNNGVLRKDPNPDHKYSEDEDLVRFSFQRFQDFLMAEHSLNGLETAENLFDKEGVLGFCVEEGSFSWEWRGLIDALSVAIPEKFNLELVDVLPDSRTDWWDSWVMRESFAESVKWRSHSAFTDRTLELLNKFSFHNLTSIELLLQVAVSSDHPWNAELLHRNLKRLKLSDRDAFWTTWVNDQSDDAESCVGVLIEWCRIGQAINTKPENQFLASLVLCWLFTTTHRAIRDKATKALTNILLENSDIYSELISRFSDVDDLYILERILGAAYASCCLSPERSRLQKYSEVTFDRIFRNGSPPYGILLRDYALGIIECASFHSALAAKVDTRLCSPPYTSPKLRLNISKEKLKEIANKAGDDEIVYSSTGDMGDFAKYEIESRTRNFLRVSLDMEIPLSIEHKKLRFQDDIIGNNRDRILAFSTLERTLNPYQYGIYSISFEEEPKPPSDAQIHEWKEDIAEAEASFLSLLSEDEISRYRLEVLPYFNCKNNDRSEEKGFNVEAIKRWIAKRAYKYGWTKKKFENDRSYGDDYSSGRPNIERIGKKYQWLALDEALSRLADNYWMDGEYGDYPKQYNNPLDIGFERDIDPTILGACETNPLSSQESNQWAFSPFINLEQIEEENLNSWPFSKDLALELNKLPFRIDGDGVKWLVVYEQQSSIDKYDRKDISNHGFRMKEFRFLATVFVKSCNAKEIAQKFKKDGQIDIMHWAVSDVTDAAFLYEAPWRVTWPQDKWIFDNHRLPSGIGYAQMATNYHWESHLDAAIKNGFSSHIPTAWMARELDLHPDTTCSGVWRNEVEEIVFCEYKGEDGETVCLLRMDEVDEIAGSDCTILSVFISERNAWPGGRINSFSSRRAEGVCWRDQRGMKSFSWYRDTCRDS